MPSTYYVKRPAQVEFFLYDTAADPTELIAWVEAKGATVWKEAEDTGTEGGLVIVEGATEYSGGEVGPKLYSNGLFLGFLPAEVGVKRWFVTPISQTGTPSGWLPYEDVYVTPTP